MITRCHRSRRVTLSSILNSRHLLQGSFNGLSTSFAGQFPRSGPTGKAVKRMYSAWRLCSAYNCDDTKEHPLAVLNSVELELASFSEHWRRSANCCAARTPRAIRYDTTFDRCH